MSDVKSQAFRHDDIDLLAVLERSLSFFKQYKWVFIIAVITGLLLGYLRYRSLPSVYKSRLVLLSVTLSNQSNIEIASNWNSLLRSREYSTLSKILNCAEGVLKKVKEIKPDEIQRIFTPNNPNGFTIDVQVTDVSILDELQKGIVYGFDNSEFVKARLAERRSRLQELISKTRVEIERLESEKKTLEDILNGKKPGNSLIIDASGISRQLIDLNEKHLTYKEELKLTASVQVLQGFTKFNHPAGHNLLLWLFLGLALFLAIAFLFALFHSINKRLKERSQSLKNYRES